MAYNGGSFIKTDRFGNAFQNKKAYTNDAGFSKAHVELGGKLYCIEFGSESRQDEKTGRSFVWVRVTSKKKRDRATSM